MDRTTPSCWTPPVSLPDLPPGEAVRETHPEWFGAPARFPPHTAPGYRRAQAMGLLPAPVPDRPPAPVPGLTSWDRVRLGLLGWFVLMPLAVLAANRLDPDGATWVLAFVAAGAGTVAFYSTPARDRLELAAGYTSGPTHAGLWRLARDGRVLREPDRSVHPPGWYPSPYFPGVLQRWEGPGWAPLLEDWWDHEEEYFRRPLVEFL